MNDNEGPDPLADLAMVGLTQEYETILSTNCDVTVSNWSDGREGHMRKFLLTVCACGLLLSPAFAEEKSPEEQHREESNQIGLQKMDWTRVVASGTNQRIGFFYAVNPDCSASGDINIRVTKQPEHGTVETAAATSFPNFERENIRYRCNQHEVRGQQVNYKSAEKYIGSDTLELLVLLPGGFTQEVHINIDVR
jgi:hypothetical protein